MDQTPDNCNKVRIYINVPYAQKDEAKKFKSRWDSDRKLWYFDYQADDNFKCPKGNLEILSKFEINSICHKYYDEDTHAFKRLVEYFDCEVKLAKTKFL